MALPVGNIMEYKIGYTVNGQKCLNVLHFNADEPTSGDTIPDITDSFLATNSNSNPGTIIDSMRALMGANAQINLVTAQLIYPQRWRMSSTTVAFTGNGTLPCQAQNVQASVQKKGDIADKHNIGAMHLGGLAAEFWANGLLTAGAFTLLEDLAAALLVPLEDGLGTATYELVMPKKRPIPNTDPIRYEIFGYTLVTQTIPRQELRTMRRRTIGVGI
jgi:hypothetical protein